MNDLKTSGPSNIEPMRSPYEINIRFLDRGYVVQVGCKTISFIDSIEMLLCLSEYVNNTLKVLSSYDINGVEKTIDNILNGDI